MESMLRPLHENVCAVSWRRIFLATSQVPGHNSIPKLRDLGNDNALRGEGCHTPQRAVIDEYGAMGKG